MAGRAAFRAIFFIPVILMTGLISSIDVSSNVAGSMESGSSIDMGTGQDNVSQIVDAMDIKALFSGMVIGTDMLDAITQLVNNIYDIVNRCGVQTSILLSGLQSIDPAIYESCQMEGASAWGDILEDHSSHDKPHDPCKCRLYDNRLVHGIVKRSYVLYQRSLFFGLERAGAQLGNVVDVLPDRNTDSCGCCRNPAAVHLLSAQRLRKGKT